MKWHERVLNAAAKSAADRLAKACGPEFYLAGGTALALREGHRISLDLDLFSPADRLDGRGRMAAIKALEATGDLEVREEGEGTIHARLGETDVSLFHYPYPLIEPTARWRDLNVAGLLDIAAMKLSAALGRGSRKDFIDIYWLAKKLGLPALLRAAERRFPTHRDFPLQACRALVYFDDAEKEPMPRLLAKIEWNDVKAFFEEHAPRAIRKLSG